MQKKRGWDFSRFGDRLAWAMRDYDGERLGDKRIRREQLSEVLKQTAPNISNLFRMKEPPQWPPNRYVLVADFLAINSYWLQYGKPHEARGAMSKEMRKLHAKLAVMNESQPLTADETARLEQMLEAFDLGRKPRP